MSDSAAAATPNYRTPEQEQAAKGTNTPDPYEMPLEDVNPLNAHLFADNRWQAVFERLRAEDPVHFNEIETAGRYWSLTKYKDIKAVDTDWENFSSANGITLGFPVGTEIGNSVFSGAESPFIAQDPPSHDVQRKSVTGIVAPSSLANLEPLIRERTCKVLDSLPHDQAFDWVDTVSIELTTLMLATLFDFPLEDRRKLTRWSDVVFAIPEPGGIVETQEEKRQEFIDCVTYFAKLFEERRENPGDDLVSMLVHGETTKNMQPLEHLGNLLLLIVGGNDTTRNTMSGSVYGLNKFPQEYDKLVANPGLIPKMVAEVIRWQTPLAYMRRTANADIEIGGKQVHVTASASLVVFPSQSRTSFDVMTKAEGALFQAKLAGRDCIQGYEMSEEQRLGFQTNMDIGEQVNLASQYPEKLEEMRKLIASIEGEDVFDPADHRR